MHKCKFCKYKNIDHIIFYDVVVDKCSRCEIIKVSPIEYSKLIKSYINIENFANAKKKFFNGEFSKYERQLIDDFIDKMSISNFRSIRNYDDVYCNFCKNKLSRMWNINYKKFKIYYCDYCNSIFFDKTEFKDAANYYVKYIIKRNKWYGFIYKFLEIFQ